jgi:hypothetical protein
MRLIVMRRYRKKELIMKYILVLMFILGISGLAHAEHKLVCDDLKSAYDMAKCDRVVLYFSEMGNSQWNFNAGIQVDNFEGKSFLKFGDGDLGYLFKGNEVAFSWDEEFWATLSTNDRKNFSGIIVLHEDFEFQAKCRLEAATK